MLGCDFGLMSAGNDRRFGTLALLAVAWMFVMVGVGPTNASEKPFNCEALKGKWRGFGWFEFVHEERERARCHFDVACKAGPSAGSISLKCNTPSWFVDAAAAFNIKGARATGDWVLKNWKVDGTVSGTATQSKIDVFMRVRTKEFNKFGAGLKVNIQKGGCRAGVKVKVNAPVGPRKIDLSVRRC